MLLLAAGVDRCQRTSRGRLALELAKEADKERMGRPLPPIWSVEHEEKHPGYGRLANMLKRGQW